jgi:hypothetical protein
MTARLLPSSTALQCEAPAALAAELARHNANPPTSTVAAINLGHRIAAAWWSIRQQCRDAKDRAASEAERLRLQEEEVSAYVQFRKAQYEISRISLSAGGTRCQ